MAMPEATDDTIEFLNRVEAAFRDLFERARSTHELHFALALAPEFRGCQDAGWCTWEESHSAFDEYSSYLEREPPSNFKTRVALSFYCHLAEASGYYEAPKNMMRIVGGQEYVMWPFLNLNSTHGNTGKVIAPNANKVFKDLAGHAKTLGLTGLAECFRDAFDPDIRNAYAHADYILWSDGLRLRRQAGGLPRVISWPDFTQILLRGYNFYGILRQLMGEYLASYTVPKTIEASMSGEPAADWTIAVNPVTGAFSISSR
jgi:hypothetical protein